MLSRTSRQEILHKLEVKVGHPVDERELSLGARQAIINLADVQRHLLVISEILNGEQSRVEQSRLLSLSSKFHEDKEIKVHAGEISMLQTEIDSKISELSAQILQEYKARQLGQPPPERQGGVDAIQLKCPTCGATLPMPTGRFVKCEYCNSVLSIQDVSSQIKTMIQNI
jgi:DNA-directed RNA polymerase subunit RPC12/RpoP